MKGDMKTINTVIRVAHKLTNPKTDGDFTYPITVAPSQTGVIIINYPGYNGSLGGYEDKYIKIAGLLLGERVGSVVLTHNVEDERTPFRRLSVARLRNVIELAILNAQEWCGSAEPDIYLMGHSAGASASAAVLGYYPQVKKALLTSPSGNAGDRAMQEGLLNYRGELFVTVGEREHAGFHRMASAVIAWAPNARIKQHRVIPGCDHQFTGRQNGKILSKAPFWAFAGDQTFPDPEGGVVLYE